MIILHIIPNIKKRGTERIFIDIIGSLKTQKRLKLELILVENQIKYDISYLHKLIEIVNSDHAPMIDSLWKLWIKVYSTKGLHEEIEEHRKICLENCF